MSTSREPYLSVVVTTRNDDHGGDPLQRFQAFVHSFVGQCRRYALDAELIVVEWNPPDDRPRLVDALRWPEDPTPCAIRIIEVPNALHRRMKGSQSLPLFQMIGKNVGIRRARGRFILCTNIDIIFSNELFSFISSRRLEHGRGYRVVRYDVAPGFPQDADVDTLLDYCRRHQIRGNFPNGSFPVEADGSPALFDPDIADPSAGIRFGRGWHMREGASIGRPFRWIADRAEIILTDEAGEPRSLALDLEPNRYAPSIPVHVVVTGDDGAVLDRWVVTEPSTFVVTLPPGPAKRRVWLNLENIADLDPIERPVYENRDRLRYVAAGVRWHVPSARMADAAGDARATVIAPAIGWQKAVEDVPLAESRDDGLHLLTLAAYDSYGLYYSPLRARHDGVHHIRLRYAVHEGEIILGPLSHDELWWRDHTMSRTRDDDEASIELSVPLKENEQIRLVVYNQHPGGDLPSSIVIRDLRLSEGLEITAPETDARSMRRRFARGLKRVLPDTALQRLKTALTRTLLPLVEWQTGDSLADQVYQRLQEERRLSKQATLALVSGNEELHARVMALSPLTDVEPVYAFLRRVHPDPVNANACGDFLLMAREHWFELRGYAEFEMYSMNIDGLFTYTAHYGGAPELQLELPMCIYHMEHAVGSGWTPEGEARLRQRMEQGQVGWLDWQTVALWVSYMHWLKRPMIFNRDDWGFGELDLAEVAPATSATATKTNTNGCTAIE